MKNFIANFMNKFNKPKRIESKKEKRKRKRVKKVSGYYFDYDGKERILYEREDR